MVQELTRTDEDALIEKHIGPHPSDYGTGRYWLKRQGVPVWAIIGQWQIEGGDAGALSVANTASVYHVTEEEVQAALAFYERHRAKIDAILIINGFDDDADDAYPESEEPAVTHVSQHFNYASGEEQFAELANLPLDALRGISVSDAAVLREVFGARTIRDLATNRYVVIAQAIVSLADVEKGASGPTR